MDRLTKEQRRRNMQAVKATGSEIERLFARALCARDCRRYRKNNKKVFGKPDFTFRRQQVAVFVDGEFWHGKDWRVRKFDHKSNVKFWLKKIERNMQRGREVNRTLRRQGWKVLRFWGRNVRKNADRCADRVAAVIHERTNQI